MIFALHQTGQTSGRSKTSLPAAMATPRSGRLSLDKEEFPKHTTRQDNFKPLFLCVGYFSLSYVSHLQFYSKFHALLYSSIYLT